MTMRKPAFNAGPTFSTQTECQNVITCGEPLLTVGFSGVCPGPNTVTLANGAVVDLNQLGAIVSQFCPAFACPVNVTVPTVTAAPTITPTTTPFGMIGGLGLDPTMLPGLFGK